MIETILRGIPEAVFTVALTLCLAGIIVVLVAGVAKLWVYNRTLGCAAMVTLIVVATLILSYFVGLAPA